MRNRWGDIEKKKERERETCGGKRKIESNRKQKWKEKMKERETILRKSSDRRCRHRPPPPPPLLLLSIDAVTCEFYGTPTNKIYMCWQRHSIFSCLQSFKVNTHTIYIYEYQQSKRIKKREKERTSEQKKTVVHTGIFN